MLKKVYLYLILLFGGAEAVDQLNTEEQKTAPVVQPQSGGGGCPAGICDQTDG